MGIHLVALAVVHLSRLGGGGGGATTQLVGSLVWPYLLRLCLTIRVAHQDHHVITSSRLFLFQLAQIIVCSNHHHHHHHHHHNDQTVNDNTRWARVLRLVRQRFTGSDSNGLFGSDYEDSFRDLSAFAL